MRENNWSSFKKNNFTLIVLLVITLLSCSTCETISHQLEDAKFINSLSKQSPKDALILIDSVLLIKNHPNRILAILYSEKGKQFSKLQKDREAVTNFEKALTLFKNTNNDKEVAKTLLNLGTSNAFILKKEIALEQLLKSLELCKSLKNDKLKALVYNELAHIHYLYKDFDKAINYTLEAAEIQKIKKDTLNLSITYNNMAVIYKNIQDLSNALKYNTMSLSLNIDMQDDNAIAKSLNNLGQVFELSGNAKEAIAYYLKAAKLNESLQILNSNPLKNLGSIYLRTNEIEKAKTFYLKALQIENQLGTISKRKDIYNMLLNISIQNKNFEKSLLYQEKREQLYLEEIAFENNEKVRLIENQYQLAVTEIELEKEKNSNDKNRIIFIAAFLMLLLIALFIFQKNRNRKLKLEHEKMRLEQKVLRSQMSPHFIFNALTAIQNSLLDNDSIKSATYISRFSKLLRNIFDSIQYNEILLVDEMDTLQNYIDIQKLRFKDKFNYFVNISEKVDINMVEIPPLLIQPLLENAIEHGFKNKKEKGEITLSIFNESNQTCYKIKDNGNGFKKNKKLSKIHAIDIFKKRLMLRGFNEEKTFTITTSSKGTIIKFCLKQ